MGRPWYARWCSRQQPWHRRRIIHTLMNSLLLPSSRRRSPLLALAASALPPSLRSHESLSIFAITSLFPRLAAFLPLVARFRERSLFISYFFQRFIVHHPAFPLPWPHSSATRDVYYREMKSPGMFASRRSRSCTPTTTEDNIFRNGSNILQYIYVLRGTARRFEFIPPSEK